MGVENNVSVGGSFRAFRNNDVGAAAPSQPAVETRSTQTVSPFQKDGFDTQSVKPGAQLNAVAARNEASPADTARALVEDTYRQLLMREPDAGGLETWSRKAEDMLRQGYPADMVGKMVGDSLRASDEYQAVSTVNQTFQDVLGRTPGELGYWHEQAKQWQAEGVPLNDIRGRLESAFHASDEYQLGHLGEVVDRAYHEVLGRAVDPSGLETYTAKAEQLKAEGKSPAEIQQAISSELKQSEEYRLLTQKAQAPQGGTVGQVPLMNQRAPAGNDGSYWNGDSNCGCTSMAMVARAFGYGADKTDAQLIMDMYQKCGTQGENGTPVGGIAQGARAIGLEAQLHPSSDGVAKMAEDLRNGKLVVANGDWYALPVQGRANTSNAGHYVAVTGLDGDGNFLVNEPWGGVQVTVTPAQMERFLREAPNGGYFTSISKP